MILAALVTDQWGLWPHTPVTLATYSRKMPTPLERVRVGGDGVGQNQNHPAQVRNTSVL